MDDSQLQPGAGALRLSGPLEQEFRRVTRDESRQRISIALSVALLAVVFFAALDFLFLPDEFSHPALGIRFGLMLPILLLALCAVHFDRLRAWQTHLVVAAVVLCGWASLGVGVLAAKTGVSVLFPGLVLATIYAYFFLELPLRVAIACGLTIFLSYGVVTELAAVNMEARVYNLAFLATSNLIGAAGCYSSEHIKRSRFLAMRTLNRLITTDPLTGLGNGRRFAESLEQIWRQMNREGGALLILLIDINAFNAFNRRYGHAVADACLCSVANAIQRGARRPYDLPARLEGDKFALLLGGPRRAHALMLAEQVCDDVRALQLPDENGLDGFVSVSVGGTYVFPKRDCGTAAEALEYARLALAEAKEYGPNQVVFRQPEANPADCLSPMFNAKSLSA